MAPVIQAMPHGFFDIWISNQHPGVVPNYLKSLGLDIPYREVLRQSSHIPNLLSGLVWAAKMFFVFAFRFIRNRGQIRGIVVHGDTATCAIAAVAARIAGLKLAHVEAGLRTGNLLRPFPEELCRFVSDLSAHINYAPSKIGSKT